MADSYNFYIISYTDNTKGTISIPKSSLITNVFDVTLVGKTRLEYGQELNENLLHLLENFACPEDPNNANRPDLNSAYSNILENPTEGQIWYNKTKKRLYVYRRSTSSWASLSAQSDIAGNSGVIADGELLPLPISNTTGEVFSLDNCSWIITPFNVSNNIDFFQCYGDATGKVISKFRVAGYSTIQSGLANYTIIGIKDNVNLGNIVAAPIATPAASSAVTPTPTVTPSFNPSATPTPTVTRTVTPTLSSGISATPAPSVTPTTTRSPTPAASRTPTQSPFPQLSAVLLIQPSVGYPAPNGTTSFPNCSEFGGGSLPCEKPFALVVSNLSGGNGGPYTVTWNVQIATVVDEQREAFYYDENLVFNDYEYTAVNTSNPDVYLPNGGTAITTTADNGNNPCNARLTTITGQTAPQVAGSSPFIMITAKSQCLPVVVYSGSTIIENAIQHTGGPPYRTWSVTIYNGSYVTISDTAGNSRTFYTPAGSKGNVNGTQNLVPAGDYSDFYGSYLRT